MTERTIATPAVRFHALEEGSGPLVLCLHGFPDTARSFRHQLPALAAAGFHAVAPYMRGYAPSGRPGDGRYDAAALGADVIAILDALGEERAIVIGHDWGAVATYFAALLAPQRITKLVGAAVPYGPQLFRALATSWLQQKRSWYMFFFQQPLADHALPHDDFAMLAHLWRDWSPGWRWSPEDMDPVQAAFRAEGTVEAALAYYRQTIGPALADPAVLDATAQAMATPIEVPGMVLHGADDGCVGAELVPPMRDLFPRGLRVEIVPDAGHFLHQERPELVNALLLAFLRA